MRLNLFPLLLASSLLFVTQACGNDTTSKLIQVGDDHDGTHLFDPGTDGRECLTSAVCEDGDLCTENRCVDAVCVSFTVPTEQCCETDVLFSETFDETIADGVTFSQLNGSAGWHVLPARAASPPEALYFGDPERMTYNVGVHVAGEVRLPAVELPRDRETVLTMRLYALIETNPQYDIFQIDADIMDGGAVAATTTLFRKRDIPVDSYQGFALVSASMKELAGATVVVRISFDSVDDLNNGYEGVWIDDIQLLASCPLPTACATDVDCDDGDACTAEACSEAGCVSTNICNPIDNPITDVEENPCAQPGAPADCCTSDADCEDGNPATVNVCDGATCAVTLNPDQCLTAADCDDAEACTTEICGAGGVCEFQGTIGAGCCTPGTQRIADFDNETLQGIYVTDNFETGIFWTPDLTRSTSGKFALYCGDPVTQTYTYDRRVKSSATTRPLEIPVGGTTRIEFDLFKATRTAINYDVFQVFVLRDGALQAAWSSKLLKDGTTAGAWQHIAVPLTAYAGQQVQLRFVFDSVGVPPGSYEGTYIDSITLETGCQ